MRFTSGIETAPFLISDCHLPSCRDLGACQLGARRLARGSESSSPREAVFAQVASIASTKAWERNGFVR